MPIHLRPLTRRQFLVRSLAVGTGVAAGQGLFAAAKSVNENSWALFSDPHLAADKAFVFRGVNMSDHFRQAAREVLELDESPGALLVAGDCAYGSGEQSDYQVFAELLEPIRKGAIPVHLMVGNHDHREHFWQAFPEEKGAQRPVADRQVALVQSPRANWFMLDSLEKTQATPGLLGKAQLDWLAATLDAHPTKPAVVVVHHNPGLSGNLGLKDTPAFFEVIRPRRQVKAYIYGHTHAWKVEADPSGIHWINLPAVSYSFAEGEPNGWVLARLEEDGIRLELRCVDRSQKAHGQVVNLKWRGGDR